MGEERKGKRGINKRKRKGKERGMGGERKGKEGKGRINKGKRKRDRKGKEGERVWEGRGKRGIGKMYTFKHLVQIQWSSIISIQEDNIF